MHSKSPLLVKRFFKVHPTVTIKQTQTTEKNALFSTRFAFFLCKKEQLQLVVL